ncbi:MAG: 6-pyruvoyl tetrahydropterin synthase family protein [Methanobacteriota archaeon]|nr:MAG: 6-pyruvoyl tetrahydropterin synthase family protein [Euryarchaeota archaeon]
MEIRINGWEAGIRFSAGHFVPRHKKCERMHGHIYAINAIIHGEQDEDGMVLDFLEIKKTLKKFANELDHRVILPGNSDFVKVEVGDEVQVKVSDKRYAFPLTDVVILDTPNTSAEELAKFLLKRFLDEFELNERIKEVAIGVDEGPAQGAWATKRF